MNVKLGYEVGTGAEVSIPVAHMIVTGQTQLSGKTTTLEGLVHRAQGMRALAFVTKRGEGTFGGVAGRRRLVRPYFRERADWQFVSAILEAETRERMKFERAWIMRATHGARTLDDVRKKIAKLQNKSKRSMDQDIYMQLGAYLDAVLPVLQRIDFAPSVQLQDGLNIVQLENLPVQVQGLVIASMLQWVHERERNVTTILPESWKFIPQGRNSPVKLSTVSLAREGAGIGNLLWLDSQDIAGAEKEIVRQASVWLIGVQREANEIKRALGQMGHGIKKPTAAAVARLKCGEFYACWGTSAVHTYVQPAWMDDASAQQIARGDAVGMLGNPNWRTTNVETTSAPSPGIISTPVEFATIGTRPPVRIEREGNVHPTKPFVVRLTDQPKEDDDMTPAQEQKLDALDGGLAQLSDTITRLCERLDNPVRTLVLEDGAPPPRITRDADPVGVLDEEAVITRVIARLKKEAPKLLKILLTRPELEVVVERETITADGKSLRGRIGRMIHDGYLVEPKSGYAIWQELSRTGTDHGKANVYGELGALLKMGFVEKVALEKGDGFKTVADMKVNVLRK